jgi:NAD(P)-dependent dehydrogenase (short-subunit alcohol dehydrogenase family)
MVDTAVVLGAGPGLGAAIARRFLSGGYAVALLARDPARLERLAGEVGAAAEQLPGGAAVPAVRGFPADVSAAGPLRDALAEVARWRGDPSVAVYNPSLTLEAVPTALDRDAFERGLALGVSGFLTALQAVAPAMRAAGRGTVLATGSVAGLRPSAGYAGLSAQKAALRVLAIAAAQELAPDGIHVATVTIMGLLGTGAFAPDRVAQAYWALHVQPREQWQAELQYAG